MPHILSISLLFYLLTLPIIGFGQDQYSAIIPTNDCEHVITVPLNQNGTVDVHAIALNTQFVKHNSPLDYYNNSLLVNTFNCADIGYQTTNLGTVNTLGKKSSDLSTIEIVDNLPPLVQCRNVDVYLEADETTTLFAHNIDNGSVDNCGILSTTFSNGHKSINYTCDDIGSHEVTISVTDKHGNSAACSATVDIICIPNTYNTNDLANQILVDQEPMNE